MKQLYVKQFEDFARTMTVNDSTLCESVLGLFHTLFEGPQTNAALAKLRDTVGENSLETDGDGVFDLTSEAGFTGNMSPQEQVDAAINDAMATGELTGFGADIPTEDGMPTEGDFGFDDLSEGGDDFGLDLEGDASDMELPPEETEAKRKVNPATDDLSDIDLDDINLDDGSDFVESACIGGTPMFESELGDWTKSWLGILGSSLSMDAGVTERYGQKPSDADMDMDIKSTLSKVNEIMRTNPVLERLGVNTLHDFVSLPHDGCDAEYDEVIRCIDAIDRAIENYNGGTDEDAYLACKQTLDVASVKLVAAIGKLTEKLHDA